MKLSDFTIKHLSKIICGDSGYTPYLSGPNLVDLFNSYGSRDVYGKGFPSRWYYTEIKLSEINGTEQLTRLLEEIFHPRHFFDTEHDIDYAIEKVNELLQYDGYKLEKNKKITKIYTIEEKVIEAENIEAFENDYVSEQLNKCDQKIIDNDYDGAITNARTLCEAVMLDILSKYDKNYIHKGDLLAAYKRIKNILNLDFKNKDYPDSIKQILSGLNSIVNGLSNMRNDMSDSHPRKI
ncbi:MAG: abortive infection family protein [Spirochaetia bacterium]|nr:abortive infection family protein [Spirochaetia bacterium]